MSDSLADAATLPLGLWGSLMAYVAVPALLGTATAKANQGKGLFGDSQNRFAAALQSVATVVVGRNPAPTGWDHLFSSEPVGWVRVKLRNGTWRGGLFYDDNRRTGRRAYASGHGEEPGDLFLYPAVPVDAESGAWPDIASEDLDWDTAILVARADIVFLEFKYVEG